MYARLLFAAILALTSAPAVYSQDTLGIIRGTVTDAVTGTFLPDAHIELPEARRYATSNRNGGFELKSVAQGTFNLNVSMMGYENIQVSVTVRTGQTAMASIELIRSIIEIPELIVERESILGGIQHANSLPASAHRISLRQIEKFQHSDVSRALRSVPGLNIQEEDGFGLRPNIGIRGTGSERSSKISVMEDGILTAPAPYSAPAAYYFPTLGRMSEIEIRKGSSQIKYGPYTTGGALNFLSTPLPDQAKINVKLSGGSYHSQLSLLQAGHAFANGAILVESYRNQSGGFKNLDLGGPTGFNKNDLMVKFRLNTSPGAAMYQAIFIKLLKTNEASDETYLGLTGTDFNSNPFRRYAGSGKDEMKADFGQTVLRHLIQVTSTMRITTTGYLSRFSRNWYKLDSVLPTGSDKVGIAPMLSDPELYAQALGLVAGTSFGPNDRLSVKANNRDYTSNGLQTEVSTSFEALGVSHTIESGLRFHGDEMDRFQWVDQFSIQDGIMSLSEHGIPGSDSNRIESARARAFFFLDTIQFGRFTVEPGIRHEKIVLSRRDFGKQDPDRSGIALSERTNRVSVWIPGISAAFHSSENLSIFAGSHKGFAPPGSKEGTRPEESINLESGFRFKKQTLRADIAVFYTNYQNLLGSDLASAGGTGSGDQFNGGAARVRGVEALLSHNLGDLTDWAFSLPLALTYTWTDAVFKSSFESEFEPWGVIEKGFELPYVARNVASLQAGIEGTKFDLDVQVSYSSPMRTEAGKGPMHASESTDAHVIMDLGSSYQITPLLKLFFGIQNVTNSVYIAARRPAGLRPGLPRTITAGMTLSL